MIVSHNVSLVSHLLLIIHQKKIGYVPYYGKCKVSMYKMNDIWRYLVNIRVNPLLHSINNRQMCNYSSVCTI